MRTELTYLPVFAADDAVQVEHVPAAPPEAVVELGAPEEVADDAQEHVQEDVQQTEDEQQAEASEADAEEGGEEPETFTVTSDDGEELVVPKKFEGHFMRQADYTRKTQEVAEQRKAVEATADQVLAERQEQAARFEAADALMAEYADLKSVEKQLEQYKTVNWDQYQAQDPAAANRHFQRYQLLKDQQQDLSNQIEAKRDDAVNQAQQSFAKRLGEAREYAAKEITGWSPDVEKQVGDFVTGLGVTKFAMQQVVADNPVALKIMHMAMKGARYEAAQAKARQKAKQTQTKPANPVAKAATGGGRRVDSAPRDSDDIKTWMAKRNKQVQTRGGRA